MKKIILTIYQNGKIENEYKDQVFVIAKLMSFLYNKVIPKTKDYNRLHHNYNYSDLQTIRYALDNNIEYEFKNVPTSWGRLDESKIMKLLQGGEENEKDQ